MLDQFSSLAFTASFPVSITASVDQVLTCNIPTGEISFGTVTPSGTRYATAQDGSDVEVSAHTLQATTNAQGGYIISIVGPTPTANGQAINPIGSSPQGPIPGSEQYGLRAISSGGLGAVNYPFNTSQYAYNAMETPQVFAQAAGPTSTTIFTNYYMSNVSSDTSAGTYTAEEIYS